MALPYTRVEDVVTVSGQVTCHILPAPTRGIITRLVIKQLSGGSDGFTYSLYDRHDACSAVSEQSFNPDDEALGDRDLHRICPRTVVAAGTVLDQHYEKVWGYVNLTEQDPTSRRKKHEIYLEITAAGSGNKQFQIAYTVLQPELT